MLDYKLKISLFVLSIFVFDMDFFSQWAHASCEAVQGKFTQCLLIMSAHSSLYVAPLDLIFKNIEVMFRIMSHLYTGSEN